MPVSGAEGLSWGPPVGLCTLAGADDQVMTSSLALIAQVITFTHALMLDSRRRRDLHSAVRRTACHVVSDDILACDDAGQQRLRLPALTVLRTSCPSTYSHALITR